MELPTVGAWVGVHLLPAGRWLPYVVAEIRQDIPGGTLILRRPGTTNFQGIRILDQWEWMPAAKVKFQKSCPRCYGRGCHRKEKGKGEVMMCQKCKARGVVAYRSPFRAE